MANKRVCQEAEIVVAPDAPVSFEEPGQKADGEKKPWHTHNLFRRLFLLGVMAVFLVAGLSAAMAALRYLVVYRYSATTEVYIGNFQADSAASLYQELMGSYELARDFQSFIVSEGAFTQLRQTLADQLPWLESYVYKSSRHFIEAEGGGQSRIITVTVTCEDPGEAALLANECAELMKVMSQQVYGEDYVQVLKVGQAETQPVSPSRFTVLVEGAAVGLALGLLVCLERCARWRGITLMELLKSVWRRNTEKEDAHDERQNPADGGLPIVAVAAAGGRDPAPRPERRSGG